MIFENKYPGSFFILAAFYILYTISQIWKSCQNKKLPDSHMLVQETFLFAFHVVDCWYFWLLWLLLFDNFLDKNRVSWEGPLTKKYEEYKA